MNTTFYGRLTRDPEVKTSQTGTTYTTITVATQLPIKDANGNGRKSLFIGVTAFGKQGEAVAQYFKKGSRIVVDGIVNDVAIGHGQNGGEYLNFYVNMSNFHIVDTKTETEAIGGAAPASAPATQPPNTVPPQGSYPAQPPTNPPAPPAAPGYGQSPAQPPGQIGMPQLAYGGAYSAPPAAGAGTPPWSAPTPPAAGYAATPY